MSRGHCAPPWSRPTLSANVACARMPFDRADALRRLADRGVRRPRRRRWDHRSRRRARRRDAGACAPRWSTRATSRRARRRSRRSWCTAASATCSRRKSASSTRRWPSARSCARPRRTSCACCRSCSRLHHGRPAPRQARPPPRRDDVDVRPHRWAAHRQAAQARLEGARRSSTCRRCRPTGSRRRTSTTTRRPTTPGSRSTIARTAADHGAAVANYATLVGLEKDADGQRHRRARRAPTADEFEVRARTVVNATGVWADDVRALDEGTHPDIDPARPRASTSPCRGDSCATRSRSSCPVPKDRRSVFVVPWGDRATASSRSPTSAPPTPTTTARSTTRSARPTTSRTCCARSTRRSTTHDHRSRRPRHVGRAAPARARGASSERTADLSPPALGARLAERRRHRHRRQAHDLPAHGRRRGRRGHEAARPRRPQPHEARQAARRHGLGRAGPAARARRRATAPTPASVLALARARTDARRADRARPRLRPGRGRVRGAQRDGPHASTTCCRAAPAPGCSPGTRRRDAADDVAALMAAELGWDAAEQRAPGRALPCAGRGGAGSGRAARDRARRAARNARR